jgi:hypothetical protein
MDPFETRQFWENLGIIYIKGKPYREQSITVVIGTPMARIVQKNYKNKK